MEVTAFDLTEYYENTIMPSQRANGVTVDAEFTLSFAWRCPGYGTWKDGRDRFRVWKIGGKWEGMDQDWFQGFDCSQPTPTPWKPEGW